MLASTSNVGCFMWQGVGVDAVTGGSPISRDPARAPSTCC
jgi:hypothetical protein